jgi:hypothetical protein
MPGQNPSMTVRWVTSSSAAAPRVTNSGAKARLRVGVGDGGDDDPRGEGVSVEVLRAGSLLLHHRTHRHHGTHGHR